MIKVSQSSREDIFETIFLRSGLTGVVHGLFQGFPTRIGWGVRGSYGYTVRKDRTEPV